MDPAIQCLVCTGPISLESTPTSSLESLAICAECKQIVLTNQEIQTRPMNSNTNRHALAHRRPRPRTRLTRTGSTDDSDPDSFSHRFSQLMNSARGRAQSSDNESELDASIYNESELDASSYGESELDRDFFLSQGTNNVNYENYDIDPMQARLSPIGNQWDAATSDSSEDLSEWEEVSELGENLNSPNPNPNSSNLSLSPSPQWMRSRWRMGSLEIEISEPFSADQVDYVDSIRFEELLEHLGEEGEGEESSGGGVSRVYRERIPRVLVTREMVRESEGLICAVCKDCMDLGIRVLKLPCRHLYHEGCIEPWLRSRNTCPVCRFELPAKGELERYEDESTGDDDDDDDDDDEMDEEDGEEERVVEIEERGERGGGWSVLGVAAGPILSFVGIVLVLCFSNGVSSRNRNGEDTGRSTGGGEVNLNRAGGIGEGRKRWWSIF